MQRALSQLLLKLNRRGSELRSVRQHDRDVWAGQQAVECFHAGIQIVAGCRVARYERFQLHQQVIRRLSVYRDRLNGPGGRCERSRRGRERLLPGVCGFGESYLP